MTNFEYCLNSVFKNEGGLSDNEHDRGGETNYGIIQDDMAEVGMRGTPKDLTKEQAKAIFKELYWDSLMLDNVDDVDIALHIFDSAVLNGRERTVKWVQDILNTLEPGIPNDIKVDGLIGMKTLFKVNNLLPQNKDKFIDRLVSERKHRFIMICVMNFTQKIFIDGWFNRVNSLPYRRKT